MPQTTEWLHTFSWHGASQRDPTVKVPRGLQFTKLRLMADQMYYNIQSVRTKDDAVVTAKIMVFFKIVDLEKLLDSTRKFI